MGEERTKNRVERLLAVKQNIAVTLHETREEVGGLRNNRPVNFEAVIQNAKILRLALRAPVGWTGYQQLINAHYPTLASEEMRAGRLEKYQSTRGVAKVKTTIVPDCACNTSHEALHLLVKNIRNSSTHKLKRKADASLAQLRTVGSNTATTENTGINTQDIAAPTGATAGEETAQIEAEAKRSRNIEISFGLSDSEDSSAASDED